MTTAGAPPPAKRGSLGHQLRTPLNAIIGFAEILARGMAPNAARQTEYAEEILRSARQLLALIDELARENPQEPTGPKAVPNQSVGDPGGPANEDGDAPDKGFLPP